MNKGLTPELEQALIIALVTQTFGEQDAKALTEFVFEVLDYRKMTFAAIINELENVRICESCGEATYEEFMVDTEGLVNGGYGIVCDYCYENGK